MDEHLATTDLADLDATGPDTPSPQVEDASAQFVGRWNRLVSQTNWEKGKIICAWRDALRTVGAAAAACSDEAWSRRVGGVSPQHVGRLRRVFERFGKAQKQYAGLYWSHFQAALDWPDAEMWLEGAVQGQWSVSQMRQQRWEAIGAPAELKPRPEDVVHAEFDEDGPPPEESAAAPFVSEAVAEVQPAGAAETTDDAVAADKPAAAAGPAPVRPFESLPTLPADVAEAFEAFKLAIVSRKLGGWQDIARDELLAVLESLRQLALAPG
jgi:hypothetical protein